MEPYEQMAPIFEGISDELDATIAALRRELYPIAKKQGVSLDLLTELVLAKTISPEQFTALREAKERAARGRGLLP